MLEFIGDSALAVVGDMERSQGQYRLALRLCFGALALTLAASCSQSSAPVQRQGTWQTSQPAFPSKPRPKPPPPAVMPAAAQGVVTVVRGDTVYGIARRHGVPIRAVIEANRLRPPYILRVGQQLLLEPRRYHTVKPGETVYAISRLYEVDMHSLTRLNKIGPPYTMAIGRRLLLPGPVVGTPPPRTTVTARSQPTATAPPAARRRPAPRETSAAAIARRTIPQPPPRASKLFAWPLRGKIISGFGPKPGGLFNDGINIGGPRGTPVRAAEHGVVAYAGNELRGFGNLLLVRHAGGWTTAYAHNEVLHVRRGDTVRRGQVIGSLGSTGHVTGPQLHFEIRRRSQAVDPLRYLGPRSAETSVSPTGRQAAQQGPG